MRFRFFALLPALFLTPARAAPAAPDTLSPRQVADRFDSLLQAGEDSGARSLCTGMALRLFPSLAEMQRKFTPFLDTTRSRDTVLEEKCRGKWCALKVASSAVFQKPLMGMDSLRMVQALHLFRRPDGWKLAEFEELPGDGAVLTLHGGDLPPDDGVPLPLFPVSRLAPEPRSATRLRLRLSGGIPSPFPEGEGQRVLERGKGMIIIETSASSIPRGRKGATGREPPARYIRSGPNLDLTDSLLRAKALELRQGPADEAETAGRIYAFVSSAFRFELGAVLFGGSREVLRSLRGDCSEAAVLTAALLRAAGIPSRVVLGFATLGRGVFIGHAWTEALLNGRWVGVDAALREFPAGAERVALLRLSGAEDMRVAASNLMFQSLANLDIQILEAWDGAKRLPLREHHGNAEEARAFFEKILSGLEN